MAEEFEGPEGNDNLDEPPAFFPYEGSTTREPGSLGELVEVQIDGVFQTDTPHGPSRFVLLSDGGERKLPILIGGFEAQAINLPLEGGRPDRPMTHDLIRTIIERFDATIDRVVIDDLWNTIFYAKIYLRTAKEEMEIDARPSDAIALAVRFDASIYVAEGILAAGEE